MNMTGYVLFWYLLGLKLTWGHAHKTRSWYLLEVTFKKFDEHPRHFYMGVPLGNRSVYIPLIVWVSLVIQMSKSACETVCRSVRSVQAVKREFGPYTVRLCAGDSSRHTLQAKKQPIHHVYTYLHNLFYKRVQTNHTFLV